MLIWLIHSTCFHRLEVSCKLLFYYRSCALALKAYFSFPLIPVLRTSLYTVLERTTVVQIHHFTTHSSSRGNKVSCKEWMVSLQHKESNLSKQVKQQWQLIIIHKALNEFESIPMCSINITAIGNIQIPTYSKNFVSPIVTYLACLHAFYLLKFHFRASISVIESFLASS